MDGKKKIGQGVAIFLGVLGLIAAVVSDYPATRISEHFHLPLLAAMLLVIIFWLLLVGLGFVVMRKILGGRPSLEVEAPITESYPSACSISVGADCIFSCYMSTLKALELSLKSRYRELEKERYMTARNRRYHLRKFRELINVNLLDCNEPAWLNSSNTGQEWQEHTSNRAKIAEELEVIYRTLRTWHVPAKFIIILAAYRTRDLLGIIKKARADLLKDEAILKGNIK